METPFANVAVNDQNIATIWLDMPGKSANTLSPAMFAAIDRALETVQKQSPAGVIVASRKPHSFVAGADLYELAKMDRQQLDRFMAIGQAVFNRLEAMVMPTVAVIAGDCLGGGLELALACRARIAANDQTIRIGVPEATLGLVPGWGGTVRLVRTIGLRAALPLLLTGRMIPPQEALALGLVDELAGPEELLDAATRPLKSGAVRKSTARMPLSDSIAMLEAAGDAQMQNENPAPLRLLQVVREGLENGPLAGLDAERRALVELAQSSVTRELINRFFLRQAAKKAGGAKVPAGPDKLPQSSS